MAKERLFLCSRRLLCWQPSGKWHTELERVVEFQRILENAFESGKVKICESQEKGFALRYDWEVTKVTVGKSCPRMHTSISLLLRHIHRQIIDSQENCFYENKLISQNARSNSNLILFMLFTVINFTFLLALRPFMLSTASSFIAPQLEQLENCNLFLLQAERFPDDH